MTMTLRKSSETEKPEVRLGRIALATFHARAARDYSCQFEMAVRNELVINIAGQNYPLDMVIRCVTSDDEWFVYINTKVSLNHECMEQAKRLIGIADYIVNVVEAGSKSISASHHRRRESCIDKAMGLWYVQPNDAVDVFCVAHRKNADNRRIAEAFAMHDGSRDPDAGVAADHRMTTERSLLCKIAEFVGEGAEFTPIKQQFRTVKTAHRLRELIDANREWKKLPLDYDGYPRTRFFAK